MDIPSSPSRQKLLKSSRVSSVSCCYYTTATFRKLKPGTRKLLIDSTKVGIACIFLSAILTYAIYTFEKSRKEALKAQTYQLEAKDRYSPRDTEHQLNSGDDMPQNLLKKKDLLSPPLSEEVIERSRQIHLSDRYVDVMKWKVYVRESFPPDDKPKTSILLLHGQAFSSQNWIDIFTPQILAAAGYRVAAIDLPGYGKTGNSSIGSHDRGLFTAELINALDMDRPVLVSPSMSGTFALRLLMTQPELISAYIPVAPVGTGDYTQEQYANTRTPTLIIYGDRDTSLGTMSASNLRQLPVSAVVKVKNAGHACYLNQPETFHTAVINFVEIVRTSTPR